MKDIVKIGCGIALGGVILVVVVTVIAVSCVAGAAKVGSDIVSSADKTVCAGIPTETARRNATNSTMRAETTPPNASFATVFARSNATDDAYQAELQKTRIARC